MTYTSNVDFSEATDASDVTTADKIQRLRIEGSQRVKRVLSIIRAAYCESKAEIREGKTVLTPLTKEVTAETVAAMQQKRQQVTEMLQDTWDKNENAELSDRFVSILKSVLKSVQTQFLPVAKQQAQKYAKRADGLLGKRYGDRYAAAKTRAELMRDWLSESKATTTEPVSNIDVARDAIEVESEVVR